MGRLRPLRRLSSTSCSYFNFPLETKVCGQIGYRTQDFDLRVMCPTDCLTLGWMDGSMDGWSDNWQDGWMDGWTTDGRMDR